MKRKRYAILILAVILIMTVTACGPASPTDTTAPGQTTTTQAGETSETTTEEDFTSEITTYHFLMNWSGGSSNFPDGFNDGALAKAIEEQTGVRIEAETITTDEQEKLALVFAGGDLPDITNGPYWSSEHGPGQLIKEAAIDGMFLPLNDYLSDFPNVERLMTTGVTTPYRVNHLEHPNYNGERYLIPTGTPGSKDDIYNWAYNLFVRQDIIQDLGIDPADINNADAIYDLLVKIRDGNYVDINGRPVIPGSTWNNGWDHSQFLNSFKPGGVTTWDVIDGKLVNEVFNPLMDERVLFMRKLVEEGLMDPECWSQTDAQAQEKLTTGRVGVHGAHYPQTIWFLYRTLYETNPEMEYIPVGPILRSDGSPNPGQISRDGLDGSAVLFLSADIENPRKALNFINFLNSDEGMLLGKFGIEGEHYEMVDGIPTETEAFAAARTEDSTLRARLGFGIAGQFIGADPSLSRGWDRQYMEPGFVHAREVAPLLVYDGYRINDFVNDWEDIQEYNESLAAYNWRDELYRAYMASSDEEALRIINSYRERMENAGYNELVEFLEQKLEEDPDIFY